MAGNQPGGDKKVGDAAEPCPLGNCSILVQVQRQDTKEFIGGATVKLDGPTPGSGQTSSGTGTKHFDPVKPGSYKGEVTLARSQAEEFEKPKLPGFNVGPSEDKVVIVEVKRIASWIEIELIGANERPVPGEAYRITLSGGRVVEGMLDRRGRARVEAIDPGTCQVTFPDLDKDAWEKA